MSDKSSHPRRRPDYRLEELDGQLLLYHPAETRILSFNETASLIWHLCDGERTVDEIIDLLVHAFPNSADAIPAHVQATLATFEAQDAIEFT